MSVNYWMNEGIGIRTDELYPYLNAQKCIAAIKGQFPDGDIAIDETKDLDFFDIDDYMYGEPFDNLGDLLCCLDDSGTMTYGDNGDGEYYFFYAPSYPWGRSDNEPSSVEEVHKIINRAVLKICDIKEDEIEKLIDDDLYEIGWG